jgi:hypothetical protein
MDKVLLQQLRALIGQTLQYRQQPCQVVEILDREKALVLRYDDSERVVQGNQFGDATRRVKQHHTLPLFGEDNTLNPVIRAWLDAHARRVP